jgi:glycosyltransferase involved in cell wall biosynthesis
VLVFAEAARQLRTRHPEAQFLIAGDLDPANPGALTRADLDEYLADGTVIWLGHVADMPALLASCHLVCLPTWYGEGVPRSLIEGAAVARALVTTDVPGCRDICRDGVNGLLVSVRDATALARAIDRLLSTPALLDAMGRAGRARVEGEFGLPQVLGATLQLYGELSPAWRDSSLQTRYEDG